LYQSTSQHLDDAEFKAQTEKRISNGQALSVYCGYDPTARSLHIGNLVSIIMMCRLQAQAGLRPIFVIGGATGMIGDPSGKSKERQLLDEGLLEANLLGVQKDISNVFQKLQN
jgi:tyrosyl-tRNA synthetase